NRRTIRVPPVREERRGRSITRRSWSRPGRGPACRLWGRRRGGAWVGVKGGKVKSKRWEGEGEAGGQGDLVFGANYADEGVLLQVDDLTADGTAFVGEPVDRGHGDLFGPEDAPGGSVDLGQM